MSEKGLSGSGGQSASASRSRPFAPNKGSAFNAFDPDSEAEEAFVDEESVQRTPKNLPAALTLFIVQTYSRCDPRFKSIQTLPQRVLTAPAEPVLNQGRDNQDANLICRVHDTLGSGVQSFTILDLLGTGTFGQVFRCKRVGSKELVAVKVIKNKPAYHNQAQLEIKIAQLLNNQFDPHNDKHIVRLSEHFEHHGHICLVFELLNMSLLDLLTQNQFRGLPLSLVQKYARQLLTALTVLEDANIIHCDLKPENILLQPQTETQSAQQQQGGARSRRRNKSSSSTEQTTTSSSQSHSHSHSKSNSGSGSNSGSNTRRSTAHNSDVKVIDFGSACFEGRTIYSYIQSRFYRSPEVLLGCPYNGAIDMWSFACVCAEMYLGLPLFPGVSQHNQLARIVEMFGNPPDFLIECKHGTKYFTPVVPETGLSAAAADLSQQRSSQSHKPALQNVPASTKYRLKTPEEYAAETNTEVPVLKKYLKYSRLDDVILKCFPAHKLKLTPEQKEHEILRRKCFVDFLYGLFRLNPFERWTAKQAMAHPFIQGTPFTAPFVPPTDLKLQERKLLFMVNNQQRTHSSASVNGGALSHNHKSLLGATRVPTNFGGASALQLSHAQHMHTHGTASQQTRSRTQSLSVASTTASMSVNAAPVSVESHVHTQRQKEGEDDSSLKPSHVFDEEERPTLKRGAPVHMTSSAVSPLLSHTTHNTQHSTTEDKSSKTSTFNINTGTETEMETETEADVEDEMEAETETKAPRPSATVKHKPRRPSFTTRVEQQMLLRHDPSAAPSLQSTPHTHATQPVHNPSALTNPHTPSHAQTHDIRSQFHSQSSLLSAPLMSAHSHAHTGSLTHGIASSWSASAAYGNSHAFPSHLPHTNQSAVNTGYVMHAHHVQQQQQQQHSQLSQMQQMHFHTQQMQQQQQQSQIASMFGLPPPPRGTHLPHHAQAPQHPPHFAYHPMSASETYSGTMSAAGSYGSGSMLDGHAPHAMTDFAMALLRPDMDEQRRLLSQQSLNSSSGYWPASLTMQHQQHVMASSPSFSSFPSLPPFTGEPPHGAPLGYSLSSPSLSQYMTTHGSSSQTNLGAAHLGMSYESNGMYLAQQQQQQQPHQHHTLFRQGSGNSLRRDPVVNQSPRSRIPELPSFGVIRARSQSQDSVEIARNLAAMRSPQLRYDPKLQPPQMLSPNIKPSGGSVRRTSFNSGEDQFSEDFSLARDWSAGSDLSMGSAGSGSHRTPPKPPSVGQRTPRRRDSETGKVVDALAEWDPFFEADD